MRQKDISILFSIFSFSGDNKRVIPVFCHGSIEEAFLMVKYIYSYFYFFDMNIAFLYTTKYYIL